MRIAVSNVYARVLSCTSLEDKFLRDLLCVPVPGYKFMPAYKNGTWDGMKNFYSSTSKYFPAGFLPFVVEQAHKRNILVEVDDQRHLPSLDDLDKLPERYPHLRDYQLQGIEDALTNTLTIGSKVLPWPRGVLKFPTGCHRAGQKILLYDGTLKNVEDVVVGDRLMGPDSKPRVVQELIRGVGKMHEIKPTKGKSWVVNEDHVLTLVKTPGRSPESGRLYPSEDGGAICDISVWEYQQKSAYFKHVHKLFQVPVDFRVQMGELPLDPYCMGIFLGDGHLATKTVAITKPDRVIRRAVRLLASQFGMRVREDGITSHVVGALGGKRGQKNPILEIFRSLGLSQIPSESRFIPQQYKVASMAERLALLAGLLDTDGSLGKGCYDFAVKSWQLAQDTAFVARSLGFRVVETTKYLPGTPYEDTPYYRLSISGDTHLIPCRIRRKRADPRRQKKDALRTGLQVIPTNTLEPYYGFTLSGDGRYLLDDFTVTHNSGKTILAACLIDFLGLKTLYVVERRELMYQTWDAFKTQTEMSLGLLGDGKFDLAKDITFAMAQTIRSKMKELTGFLASTQTLVIDEVQHLNKGVYHQIAVKAPAPFRFGFSATPMRRGDLGDVYLVADTGEIIAEGDRQAIEQEGFLAHPRVFMFTVDQPTLHGGTYQFAYNTLIVRNDYRNDMIVTAVKKLLKRQCSILILVRHIAHGSILSRLLTSHKIPSIFVQGADSMQDRQFAKQEIGKSYQVLIATGIFDEGVDMPLLDAGIMAGGGQSKIKSIQRVGRILRPKPTGSNEVFIIDFKDTGNKYLLRHSAERLQAYEDEGFAVSFPGHV